MAGGRRSVASPPPCYLTSQINSALSSVNDLIRRRFTGALGWRVCVWWGKLSIMALVGGSGRSLIVKRRRAEADGARPCPTCHAGRWGTNSGASANWSTAQYAL